MSFETIKSLEERHDELVNEVKEKIMQEQDSAKMFLLTGYLSIATSIFFKTITSCYCKSIRRMEKILKKCEVNDERND